MLPEDGELRLGSLALPAGRRILAVAEEPVAWATIAEVPDAGRVWAELSQAHAQTGLVPFLKLPEYIQEQIEPFSRQFPGLAPATDGPQDSITLDGVLGDLPPARIGLVPAARPADILPLIGWFASDQLDDALPVAAVLRSWEDRFGATLLEVGYSKIRLLVRRPPRTAVAARQIAAEQYAFCDERHHAHGRDGVPGITEGLVGAPIWTFWWD